VRRPEGRVVVTPDKDFGEFTIVPDLLHAGILRLVGLSAMQHADVTLRVIEAHGADLASGAIITAEQGRLRVRLPVPQRSERRHPLHGEVEGHSLSRPDRGVAPTQNLHGSSLFARMGRPLRPQTAHTLSSSRAERPRQVPGSPIDSLGHCRHSVRGG
jgi:hypothetical protein